LAYKGDAAMTLDDFVKILIRVAKHFVAVAEQVIKEKKKK